FSTVDSSIDNVKTPTPLSACGHPDQFILRTPDHKSLKALCYREVARFGELHAISQKRSSLFGENYQWQIGNRQNARTYHVFAMCEMDKNTAETYVVKREA